MPEISVIIPALNEEEYLVQCLQSLETQCIGRENIEIIVVDGNSTDETRAVAEQYADCVMNQTSPGIGGARRDGALAAHSPLLAFTDADTIHSKHWLETIIHNLENHDVTTGPVLFYENTLRSDAVRLWRKIYSLFHLFDFYWLIGSNIGITSDAYARINGHSDISILDDFDLSFKTFREKNTPSIYDKNQFVYTSSRRMSNLLSYFLLFSYGHYHYHLTKDHEKLLTYPKFNAMDLKTISKIMGIHERLAIAVRRERSHAIARVESEVQAQTCPATESSTSENDGVDYGYRS